VIFVSIDDNELFRLGMLMDRVFGERNRLACFVWQSDGNFDNQARVKVCHEYVLAYCADIDHAPKPRVADPSLDPSSKVFRSFISNTIIKNGPKNPVSDISLPEGFPADFEEGRIEARSDRWPQILSDVQVKNWKTQSSVILRSGWASKAMCEEFIDQGFNPVLDTKAQSTRFVLTKTGAIESRKSRERASHVVSVLRGLGSTQGDSSALGAAGIQFSYPKPIDLVAYLVSMFSGPGSNCLDFFAGSGTTAHAVAKLNAEDGGNRKFILVSSAEATVDQPDKNLCRDVCAERVRRVLGGYTNAKGDTVPGLGGGFAYLRTQRLPRHRLTRRLGHSEIWNALRLIHEFPIDAISPGPLAVIEATDTALAYLPEWREPAVEQLLSWASDQAGKRCAIYSWTPQRLAERLPGHDIQPIPETLQLRFGRGQA
jgi:adenine-specific DNA-methyltransferase